MSSTPTPRMLRGDEADLYRDLHLRVANAVRTQVTASDALHEDACSFAWLQFLRLQPDRTTAFGWLCTVAIHEGWRLSQQVHRTLELVPDIGPATPVSTELALDAREALRRLASLPDRQRRYLTLRVAGHSYADICHSTGATRTNVNKHLVRARRTLRSAPRPLN